MDQKNDAPPRLKPQGLLSLMAVKNRRFLMSRGLNRRSFFGCSGTDHALKGVVSVGSRHKIGITAGLAGVLALSSGCAVFKSLDKTLTHFGEVLEQREQNRPENIFKKKGYRVYQGKDEVLPVQILSVTNVSKIARFSYAFDPALSYADQMYLVLSKESRDILGDPLYEERQHIYPQGLIREDRASGLCVLSYAFDVTGWEKGRYLYEWWDGMPQKRDIGFFEEAASLFLRDTSRVLLEGFFENK